MPSKKLKSIAPNIWFVDKKKYLVLYEGSMYNVKVLAESMRVTDASNEANEIKPLTKKNIVKLIKEAIK